MTTYLPKYANDAMWRGYMNPSLDRKTILALERNGCPKLPGFRRRTWENRAHPMAPKFQTHARKSERS